jgi:hypothetical protein
LPHAEVLAPLHDVFVEAGGELSDVGFDSRLDEDADGVKQIGLQGSERCQVHRMMNVITIKRCV